MVQNRQYQVLAVCWTATNLQRLLLASGGYLTSTLLVFPNVGNVRTELAVCVDCQFVSLSTDNIAT